MQTPMQQEAKAIGRYQQFIADIDDLTKEPVKVFDPFPKKYVEELESVREISRFLQNKKDEDAKKAAQAASQAEEDAKKKVAEDEVKSEEDKEEPKQE